MSNFNSFFSVPAAVKNVLDQLRNDFSFLDSQPSMRLLRNPDVLLIIASERSSVSCRLETIADK